MKKQSATVLTYGACSTCKKALAWLDAHGVEYEVRPIVDEPPTAAELASWVPVSGKPVRKWLNTSGQSYRALGTQAFELASDRRILTMLAKDGKLVKRPVVIAPGGAVLVGFDEEAYKAVFAS